MFIEKRAGSSQQDYFRKRITALISRIGARVNPLQGDGCTIQIDGQALYVVGRADRWALLVGEMGGLPQQGELQVLRRLLRANLRPVDGPLCTIALDDNTQQVMIWCQVDLRASDDAELYDVFERFVARLEAARAELGQTNQASPSVADAMKRPVSGAQTAAQSAVMARFSGSGFRPGQS